MALLEVRDLKTYFRTAGEPCRVVDGVSLTVESGETVGLVGESGCGKSLTALSVTQLIPAPGYVAGGSILLKGRDVVRLPGPEKRTVRGRHMAMIFQEPMTSLNPVLSIRTQLLEAIRHGRASSRWRPRSSASNSARERSPWPRAWRSVSASTVGSLPMPLICSMTNRSISPAGTDLVGQLCQPRFSARRQT